MSGWPETRRTVVLDLVAADPEYARRYRRALAAIAAACPKCARIIASRRGGSAAGQGLLVREQELVDD